MKKIVIVFLFSVSLVHNAHSNDGWFAYVGGDYSIVDGVNSTIRLIDEQIRIDLYPDYYTIKIDYKFYNEGDTVTLDIGFPEYSNVFAANQSLRNFKSYVDGKFVETKYIYGDPNTVGVSWYIKKTTFIKNIELFSTIEYDASYGGGYEFLGFSWNTVEYVYGTAKCWKTGIENFTIRVYNHTDFLISDFKTNFKNYTSKNKDTITIINTDQVNPDTIYDRFVLSMDIGYLPGSLKDKLYHYIDYGYLEAIIARDHLSFFTKDELRIMRNAFYARHGYVFKSTDLKDYFAGMEWYRPNYLFTEDMLTIDERKNIELIMREEKNRE